ncbi:unnamed protein product [Staurois parvus]|uniref:Uncharacterized protein n=1 Tax=Staurois parvus TaxID=386267 RepID=A0ABN9BPZ9_9NEOB|nr:unnamed protein product [Staurois parvus]
MSPASSYREEPLLFVGSTCIRPTHPILSHTQERTDHLEIRALPEGLGSVGGPMRCPWYLFHRLF